MRLQSPKIVAAPEADRVRLVAEVIYDDPGALPEQYWYEVDRKCESSLSTSGNPWLVCLLPLAAFSGEPLEIGAPVDAMLLDNAREIMQVWKCWYPDLHVVPIHAPVREKDSRGAGPKTGAFFSGGIDSFFTILRQQDKVEDLIHVWGFDIPLAHTQAHQRMVGMLRTAATDLHKEIIEVSTNIRATRLDTAGWGTLYFGCALASTGLALENRYRNVLIPSNGLGWNVPPWGSHPLTDPLLSTEDTRIVHDGFVFTRVQKTELVAQSPAARKSLHVCFLQGSEENCCACMKCYRTMATLAALGVLDQFPTLQTRPFELSRVAKMYVPDEIDRFFHHEIRALALRQGHPEVARAIERSLRHTDRLQPFRSVLQYARKYRERPWFERLRRLSGTRASGLVRDLLLRDSIT